VESSASIITAVLDQLCQFVQPIAPKESRFHLLIVLCQWCFYGFFRLMKVPSLSHIRSLASKLTFSLR